MFVHLQQTFAHCHLSLQGVMNSVNEFGIQKKIFPTFKLIKIFPPPECGRNIVPEHVNEA